MNGNDDLTIIIEMYHNDKSISEDSLYSLLRISDKNYLKNKSVANMDRDIQFRNIVFCDQLFRAKCYFYNLIDYSLVQKNDSILQTRFLAIIKDNKDLKFFDGSFYQQTFDLLLIHSVTTLQTLFFQNNFHIYSAFFSNNYKEHNLQALLDLYLNLKFNKQYFDTEYGKGRLKDKSFGLLPKITNDELKEVLFDLKVYGAIF